MFKKIAKILRGGATPGQLMASCVVGAALGFMPGFVQAPGLVIVLALALLVLNVNITLALGVAGVAKLLSLILLPLSFSVGRFLLDGPTQSLFKAMINAPVLALFGFEYYVTCGGLVIGAALGVIAGIILIRTVRRIRTRMSSLEEGSDLYKKMIDKWWVKLFLRVFVGKGSKDSYTVMLEKKGGLIRPVGVAICGLVVVLLVVTQMFFSGPFIASALRRGLEEANGATVDLAGADIDLAGGRMTLTGLAMADPNNLGVDLFRAGKIEADVSAASLLRKQLRLDRVVFTDAAHGASRQTPGKRVGNAPAPVEPVPAKAGEKTLADYLQNPEQWQQPLTQMRQWIEKISGPAESDDAESSDAKGAIAGESLRDRLEREALALGYARVMASHLIDGAPRFVVDQLDAENVATGYPANETLTIRASFLSTQPALLQEVPKVSIESSAKTLLFSMALAGASAASGENFIDFSCAGLDVDSMVSNLGGGTKPVAGGTMDVGMRGSFRGTGGTYIDLTMQVDFHNTTVAISGAGATPVSKLTIPLGIRGPIDNPRIRLDDTQLADALVAAGADMLANEVRGRADDAIQDALSDVDLKGTIPDVGLENMLPSLGGKKQPEAKQDEAPKKKDDIGNQLKGLGEGLFGKKKKNGG